MTPAELKVAFGELSLDNPAPGVRVFQPSKGYRWGVEVYALGAFAWGRDLENLPPPPATVVELGSGSGVISLLLASLGAQVWGVERDAAWVALSRQSAAASESGVCARTRFLEGDIRDLRDIEGLPARVDLVVANPPWFVPGAGPVSPDSRKAAARTMLAGTVADFLAAGQTLADRVCLITREERIRELVAAGTRFSRVVPIGARIVLAEWTVERRPDHHLLGNGSLGTCIHRE